MLSSKSNPGSRLDLPVRDRIRTDFTRISIDHTVGEALARVQRGPTGGRIVYFYVVDAEDRLCGVVPARGLLLNPPETPVADIMVRRMIKLPVTATLVDACELFMLHRLLALPVVDEENHLLGVLDVEVYTDEVVDLADQQLSNEVFQLIGVRLAEVERASVPLAFWRRFPWLLSTIGSGLICALVAGFYEDLLQRMVVLAMFIPVVLAIAESVSIQALTLTLQAQHGSRVRWALVFRSLARELPISLLLGVACGGLIAAAAWMWQDRLHMALAIWASVVFSVTTAALLGLVVPGVLLSVQKDPKVASGPIALALADVATLIYFFGIATWALG